MSGIYGYYLKEKQQKDDYITALAHWHEGYGKTASAQIVKDCVGLGCALNHIPASVPLDSPVLRKGNVVAVVDALIYNRDELAEVLPECEIAAMSDERLLLELYLESGADGLRKVNGDFAGAVYDGQTLTLFRDHMGIRPLYWYRDEKMVAFGTDMRGILSMPGTDNSLNEEFFYANATGYLVDESEVTDFACIKEVKPGYIVEIRRDMSYEQSVFWRIGQKKVRLKTEQEYRNRMRELVTDAIKRRLAVVNGRTVGAELSGGMDSTVIAVMLQKLGADLQCYSWSPKLEDYPLQHHDEREIIEATCEQFGLKCEYGFEDIAETEKYMSENVEKEYLIPGIYNSFVNSSMKYFAGQKVDIIFSGWGGDEGVSHRSNPYELWYHGEYLAYLKLQWQRSPGRWRKPLRFLKRVKWNLTKDREFFLKPWNFYQANRMEELDVLQENFKSQWTNRATIRPEFFAYNPIKDIENGANRGRVETSVFVGAKYGGQYVYPFLDYRVEDFAVSIPRHLYWKGNEFRHIYRETFHGEMPDALYSYKYKDDPGRSVAMDATFEGAEKQIEQAKRLLKLLNRSDWERYLDFEKIKMKLGAEDAQPKGAILELLARCHQVQQLRSIRNDRIIFHD